MSASDLLQLWQVAPWLAIGLLALVASAWVYRQNRRALIALEERLGGSNIRQGKRLGQLTTALDLLDLRRRQVEWVLLEDGLDLPYWPADGPSQPRARRRDVDEDLADVADELSPETQQRRIPVPPLDPAVAARHRRA